jgi:MYXO-CTERM domain-containing protein
MAIGVAALMVGVMARADVVGPPENIRCPAGSEQTSCHGSELCTPLRCSDDSDCDEGEICRQADLCASDSSCGGWDPVPITRVYSECVDDGDCDNGDCRIIRVCLPREVFDDVGCGCSAPSSGASVHPAAWLLALIPGLLVLARRRR